MGAVAPLVIALVTVGATWSARAQWERRARRLLLAGALLFSSFLPLALHMTFVEPYDLRIERTKVAMPRARVGQASVKIVVLADIQTPQITEWEERVIREVARIQPDVIVIPGDVLQTFPWEFEERLPQMQAWLSRLRAPHGVWFVSGDADRFPRRLVEGTGVKLLDGRVETLQIGDRTISMGGVPLNYTGAMAADVIKRLERAPGADDIRLLLAHRPGVVEVGTPPKGSRIDLVIAGHTHGGQIVLPFLGPPVTMAVLPRSVASGGLHEVAGRRVYISRGVGMERVYSPRLRLNCPPEISVLEL